MSRLQRTVGSMDVNEITGKGKLIVSFSTVSHCDKHHAW